MLSFLYNIIVGPIELIVEFVFELMFRILGQRQTNQGLAVIGVSLAISFLTLPLYRMADKVQQKERDTQKKLSKWVNHIKKTFKGDERFMMLQAYYKENGYSPIQALNGSLSLLLEIPFFIAAYHFLSNLEALNGASFGPFKDLGTPDNLFVIGNFGINVLPIAMTLINCISSAVYLKGFPIKDKIQTYGMALIFLVLLYNSPSGLVIYWTFNNIFSLVKNIFYKLKNPRKVFDILAASAGTIFTVAVIASGILNSKKKIIAVFLFMLLTYLPFVLSQIKKNSKYQIKKVTVNQNKTSSKSFIYFILVFITVLIGIVIPSSVIASSPAEFVDISNYQNPLRYIAYTLAYTIGFFVLWTSIVHGILNDKGKRILSIVFYALSIIFIVNYLFFGKNLGNLSPFLAYENGFEFSKKIILLNLLITLGIIILAFFTFKFSKYLKYAYIILIISLCGLSIRNIYHANKLLADMSYIKNNDASHHTTPKLFSLSRKGKNVIVFMLDRAISGYVPYLMEEKPQLKEQFSGFTYYPNTLSFGSYTNFGSPALFGGYEYSVSEINKRSQETLEAKHNEALKVLPWIFEKENYKVTICDPPYAGYKWIPDLSVFDDNPNIKKYITMGNIKNEKLLDPQFIKNKLNSNNRNFFFYSVIRTFPLFFSKVIYDDAHYFDSKYIEYNNVFYEAYSVLTLLSELTEITDNNDNTFLAIDNDTTHEPCLLQLPDYSFTLNTIDNSKYTTAADGKIKMETNAQIIHYHANMAAFIQLGKWFDWMKENKVYDNTRIIVVADHGRPLDQFDYMNIKKYNLDVQAYNPLLMVKDYNSKIFSVSNEFMTNADVPSLATRDIIAAPINPFTGKKLSSEDKFSKPQIITTSNYYQITENNGNVFDTSDGHFYSVHDNIFDETNWVFIE